MSKKFVISDIWFNRLLSNTKEQDVVDNNNTIIQMWNSVVNDGDAVYVLGGLGISDVYHLIIRLKGEIHILNNYFNESDKSVISELKYRIENSCDRNLKDRIVFDNDQVVLLPELDTLLSYFPLSDWMGKDTGVFCFHGLNDITNIEEHNISCTTSYWNNTPVDIDHVIKNIQIFKKRLE